MVELLYLFLMPIVIPLVLISEAIEKLWKWGKRMPKIKSEMTQADETRLVAKSVDPKVLEQIERNLQAMEDNVPSATQPSDEEMTSKLKPTTKEERAEWKQPPIRPLHYFEKQLQERILRLIADVERLEERIKELVDEQECHTYKGQT